MPTHVSPFYYYWNMDILKCNVLGDGILLPLCTGTGHVQLSLHVHHVETENREHWIPKHPSTPYLSPFQSFINERQQAGTLLFSLHHAIPPA